MGNEIGYFLLLLALSQVFKDAFLPLVELLLLGHTKVRHNAASKQLSTLPSYKFRQWDPNYCNKKEELW
jgi:hypothetical protein